MRNLVTQLSAVRGFGLCTAKWSSLLCCGSSPFSSRCGFTHHMAHLCAQDHSSWHVCDCTLVQCIVAPGPTSLSLAAPPLLDDLELWEGWKFTHRRHFVEENICWSCTVLLILERISCKLSAMLNRKQQEMKLLYVVYCIYCPQGVGRTVRIIWTCAACL